MNRTLWLVIEVLIAVAFFAAIMLYVSEKLGEAVV